MTRITSRAALLLLAVLIALGTTSSFARATASSVAVPQDTDKDTQLQILVGGQLVAKAMHSTPSVYLNGTIDPGAPARFERQLVSGAIPSGSFVYLNSPGGSLAAGLELGYLFRKYELFTVIGMPPFLSKESGHLQQRAICASACAYAYLGGKYREAPQPADGSPFGIHQFYYSQAGSGDTETTQKVAGMIVLYLHEMGINSDVFVLSSMTAPKSVLWLSGNQMLKLGIANNGVAPPTATYKLVKGKPYLLIEQNSYDGDHKVALLCTGNQVSMDSFYVVGNARAKEITGRGTMSYYEVDGKQVLTGKQGSFEAINNSIVLDREVSLSFMSYLLHAKTVGAWVNDQNGFLRTGFEINIKPVRALLSNYIQNCEAR